MGELRNCPKCGKVFVMVNRNLCPDCVREEEEKFEQVRSYLKKYPGATVEQIAEKFDVEENVILRWLREGRIQDAHLEFKLTCQRCGAPIRIGTLCSRCAQELTSEMMDKAKHKKREEPALKMEDEQEKIKRRMFIVDKLRGRD
ncbi:flagellar protein [Thermincola ferriacetica]|uniref:Flagellar protein n=1 Tax=Thermincola ferriacetica TaxID=281456 RepID=A0A0L6W3Z7_9FIRM|nr:TIGR03826 family flagellar region protein [Thermincola ferriacetica]KNZ70093.1 flagellar protein [Thermincola ferriacetica]